MFGKFKKSKIKKILVITLSNIGDIILTFPVIDILKEEFSTAQLSVVVGPKGESLLNENPYVKDVYVFDKHQSFDKTIAMVFHLRREHFDLVIDLRNTAIPFLVSPRYRTSPAKAMSKKVHMRLKHIQRLQTVSDFNTQHLRRYCVHIHEYDRKYIDQILLSEVGIGKQYIVVGPGAADDRKRWTEEGFAKLCDRLVDLFQIKIVFIGDDQDRKAISRITESMMHHSINLSGRTSLIQLAYLVKNCSLAIMNDSAPMHMASYLNVPVLALFGPTDPDLYGPWSQKSHVIRFNQTRQASQEPEDENPHAFCEHIVKAIRMTNEGFAFNE